MKRSDRTLKMMENFMALREEGHSVPEIAQMFGIDKSHTYSLLGEIAARNGVTRESLLDQPHSKYELKGGRKMMLHQLTAKALREQSKRGYTIEKFCKKYSCSPEELKQRIGKILSCNDRVINEAWSQLEANSKRAARHAKTEADPPEEPLPPAANGPEQIPIPEDPKLAELTEYANTLNTHLNTAQKELAEKTQNLDDAKQGFYEAYQKVQELENRIAELRTELQRAETDYHLELTRRDGLYSIRKQAESSYEQAHAKVERLEAELEAVTSEIYDKTHPVELFAYDDGHIEVLDAPDFPLDETGAESLRLEFLQDPLYGNLRVKEVHLLSRVVAISKNSDRTVKATFDSAAIQELYDTAWAG